MVLHGAPRAGAARKSSPACTSTSAGHAVLRARPRPPGVLRQLRRRTPTLRLTWQATPKQKVTLIGSAAGLLPLLQHARRHRRHAGSGVDLRLPDVSEQPVPGELELPARRSRLLFEAGTTLRVEHHLVQKPAETGDAALGQRARPAGMAYGSLFSGATTIAQQLRRSRAARASTRRGWRCPTSPVARVQGRRDHVRTARRRSAASRVYNDQYMFRNRRADVAQQVAFPHRTHRAASSWTSACSRRTSGRSASSR